MKLFFFSYSKDHTFLFRKSMLNLSHNFQDGIFEDPTLKIETPLTNVIHACIKSLRYSKQIQ